MASLRFRHRAVSPGALLIALLLVSGSMMSSMTLLQLHRPSASSDAAPTPSSQGGPVQRIKSKKDHSGMILIPAGPFVYGVDQKEVRRIVLGLKTPMAEIYRTELPKTTKNLESFYIGRYEVTNEQYTLFVRETNHRESRYARYPQLNGSRQPVVGVGWEDAKAYCSWAGMRLPSEEEWEKAARGTDGRTWPWGNEPDDTRYNGRNRANYAPVNVGSYPSGDSPYGVSDMAGNVWEMTSGTWNDGAKAMRGGSLLNPIADVRVTVRWAASNEDRGANWLGFRCVMDVGNARQAAAQ
jgi:formylglycine-generating enzyme required for sulfatase activity